MKHRSAGLAILDGSGLEIGAMHNPTQVPGGCNVDYFDVVSRQEAMALFPELPAESFQIEPKYIGDLDKDGLGQIEDTTFDFVILNHVIEHVANPIKVIAEIFRVVRPGGHVVISCPDKRFTFDRPRALTTFEHLRREYEDNVCEVTDDHYLDFLAGVHPELMSSPEPVLNEYVKNVRNRREHAHVWDSAGFRAFLERSYEMLGVHAQCVYEVPGDENEFEFFSVWRRVG